MRVADIHRVADYYNIEAYDQRQAEDIALLRFDRGAWREDVWFNDSWRQPWGRHGKSWDWT